MKNETGKGSIDAYIASSPQETRVRLNEIRDLILQTVPQIQETISWGMPTFKLCNKNLAHFATCKHHLGFYPGEESIGVFKERLADYKTSKGAVQFPWSKPLPKELIRDMLLWQAKHIKEPMTTCNGIVNIANIETELGLMIAGATEKGICMFEFADYKLIDLELRQLSEQFKAPLVEGDNPHFVTLRNQLAEYFRGERKEFSIPLDLVGTEFQKTVWLSLLQIPYGCTTSYGKQAELIGKSSSVRAVANANGKNKISIILPCHRVIGTDGSLTGYGGGIWRKKKLLEFERENVSAGSSCFQFSL